MLFLVPVKNEVILFLLLFVLVGVITGVTTIIWSYQARKIVNGLLFTVEEKIKRDGPKLAHDIRNILAIIQADVEIALMGEVSGDELRKTLKQIMTETDEINSKLNEV